MIFSLLLCLTVSIHAAMLTDNDGQNNRLENKCNQDIPEGQSVELNGECRSSVNCQQANLASQCVYKRENYCRCELIGEESKIKKHKLCEKNEGHSCSRKSKCAKKYRKRRKICKHRRHVCCTKCKNLNKYGCVPSNRCSGPRNKQYQCGKKSKVCCKYQECEDIPPHTCINQDQCKPGTVQPGYYCEGSSTVCCEKQPACASLYTTFRGHKLKGFSDEINKADAKAACEAEGARLPIIKDANMGSAIADARTEAGMPDSTWLWIALEHVSEDASFHYYEWDNGETFKLNLDGSDAGDNVYTDWYNSVSHDAEGGLDLPPEKCFMLFEGVKWEDLGCERDAAYVCECV